MGGQAAQVVASRQTTSALGWTPVLWGLGLQTLGLFLLLFLAHLGFHALHWVAGTAGWLEKGKSVRGQSLGLGKLTERAESKCLWGGNGGIEEKSPGAEGFVFTT